MTQYALPTIDPAVHTGTDLANFLNGARPAFYSYHRGSSRPAYAVAGMIWIDSSVTNVDSVKYFDGTQDSLLFSIDTITGNVIEVGGTQTGSLVYKGTFDPTATAPASPIAGDMYIAANAGTADASYTGIAGDSVTTDDVIFWDGTAYQYLVKQSALADYLPLTGGTLTGDFNLSNAAVLQPFTTLVPATTYGIQKPVATPNGGLLLEGYSAGSIGVGLSACANSPDITGTLGVVHFDARKGDGAGGVAVLGNNDVAFAVGSSTTNLEYLTGLGQKFIKAGVSTGGAAWHPGINQNALNLKASASGVLIALSVAGVAQPVGGFGAEQTAAIGAASTVGLAITGSAPTGATTGVLIAGYGPDSASAKIAFNACQQIGGGGGITSIGNEHTAFQVMNNNSSLLSITGNGDTASSGRIWGKTQTVTATTGATTTPDANTQNLILNHAATIATHTIVIPEGLKTGQQFDLISRSDITALTINTTSGQGINDTGGSSILAGGVRTWVYDSVVNTWYITSREDHAEGSWTPFLVGSTAGAHSSAVAVGTYKRIGKMVTCHFNIEGTVTTAFLGDFRVSGLPLPANGPTGMKYSLTGGYCTNFPMIGSGPASTIGVQGTILLGESVIRLLSGAGTTLFSNSYLNQTATGTGMNLVGHTFAISGTIIYEV